jgi:hypothetical protein
LRQKSRIPCSNATPHHHFQQQNRTVATQIPKFLYHRWHRQQIPTLTHNAIGKLFSEKPYQNQKNPHRRSMKVTCCCGDISFYNTKLADIGKISYICSPIGILTCR